METINNIELMNIKAGGLSWAAISGILSGVVFIIGVVDGYLRPYKCR